MVNNFLIWLAESSIAIALLALTYNMLLEKLTFFTWNRVFLLGGMVLCLVVPLVDISPFFNITSSQSTKIGNINNFNLLLNNIYKTADLTSAHNTPNGVDWINWVCQTLFAVYIIGAVRQAILLEKGLLSILYLKADAYLTNTEPHSNIFIQSELPTFSFGRKIFLNRKVSLLTETELELVLLHEKIHVRQKHTVDILFVESMHILFWFNPCFKFLVNSLKQVHEFIADWETSNNSSNKKEYGRLLLKLATPKYTSPLIHTFSESQLFHRLKMLTKTKSNPMQKLKFLSFLPILAITAMISASFINAPVSPTKFTAQSKSGIQFTATSLKIGKINWEGNTKFSNDELLRVLGIEPGDRYDALQIEQALNGAGTTGKDLSSLYMDQGYLFFRVEPTTKTEGNTIDITFKIYEGKKAKIGKVIFAGNKSVSSDELLKKIQTKTGDLFSRKKLIESQQTLSDMGEFVPNNININPIPDQKSFESGEVGNVDIEFILVEK